jgi:hypothetical protein
MKKIITLLIFISLIACSAKDKDSDQAKPSPENTVEVPAVSFQDLKVDLGTLENLSPILDETGARKLQEKGFHGQNIKVAVFDNGYSGLNHSIGNRLPIGLSVVPSLGNSLANTSHGTKMAEIVYAVASGSAVWNEMSSGPEIILYNTNGFSNLKAAVDDAVRRGVDVILYAQVWEYGDNDGTDGFINAVIKKATDKGIIWINASGNFGDTTYRSKLVFNDKGNVSLPFKETYLRVHVRVPTTDARIVLAWNDFDQSPDYQTPQDLDLTVYDSTFKKLGSSAKEQNGGRDGTHSMFSAHAREILTTSLAAGTYYIAVDAKSRNFDDNAQISVAVDGFGITLPEATGGDSLMAPAGNPAVLAVGAVDSQLTSVKVVDGAIVKPEIFVTSAVNFSDGVNHDGTSAASAIAAGALAVWLSANGKTDIESIKSAIASGQIADRVKNFCLNAKTDCYLVNTLNLPVQ